MGKEDKKKIRSEFRRAVYERDRYTCRGCGLRSSPARAEEDLDAHHITDRNEMPSGGYVAENGISLCKAAGGCHEKAEVFHSTGAALPGFSPDDLYRKIGSSREKAEASSRKLGAVR